MRPDSHACGVARRSRRARRARLGISRTPRARRGAFVGLVVVVVALAAGCGGGSGGESSGPPRPSGAQAGGAQLLQGWRVYATYCARCHGLKGEGGIGPRLAGRVESRYPNVEDQMQVVRDGRAAMPAWSGTLSDDQIDAVVRYEREVL